DDVPDEIKGRRLEEIIRLQQNLSLRSNRSDIGKTFEVLAEGYSKRSNAELMGRNSQNKVVIFKAENHFSGQYLKVKITSCSAATLRGTPNV
ncbi:MAG: TRAM domain-containing protein, partial [Bacteroidales bacterium]|nr:TRAM domain-containing protein [Bacteroidales bacterium]